MAWQGIPFPLNGSIGLLIEKIPHLDVTTKSGFGWDTIAASVAGAIIASAIPAGIAWWSIRNNNRTMREDRERQFHDFEESRKTQITIADEGRKAQIIAANRLVWIKDLREASAEFVASAYNNLSLCKKVVILLDEFDKHHLHLKTAIEYPSSVMQAKHDAHDSFVSLVLHTTRIKMMLNPDRLEHTKVMSTMDNLKQHAEEIVKKRIDIDGVKTNIYIGEFISDMQRLLKEEWEKAKRNS
ncbi:hypothetical protein JAF95_002735 [Citrobacter braakii]|nr:hypothetical protein [Citrobacter braakii]HEB0895704.1 hypothetical protein [Citrobacter braakii]